MSVTRDEFENLLHRVEALEDSWSRTAQAWLTTVLEGFDRIDRHLDRHDEQFEQVQRRLDGHDEQFDRIERHLDRHDEQFEIVQRKLDGHDEQFEQAQGRLGRIEGRLP